MNIIDFVIDYLNAFVVSEQLTNDDASLCKRDDFNYFLYINRINNLKVCTHTKFCVLYVDCAEDEEKLFEKMIDGKCPYSKSVVMKFKNSAYVTDSTYRFYLYKEEKALEVFEIVLRFLKLINLFKYEV